MNVEKLKDLIREGIRSGQSLPLLQARRMADEGDLPDSLAMDVIKNICTSMKHGNRAPLDASVKMLEDYELAAEPSPPPDEDEDKKPAPRKSTKKATKKRGKKKKTKRASKRRSNKKA